MNIFLFYTEMSTSRSCKSCTCSDLSAAVLELCEQIKTVANGYCWFARKKANSHQSKSDPCQPILARLTVCVKERFDTLEDKQKSINI